jgi:hypothetical protein
MKEFGVDPLKISEAVVLFAPPERGPDPQVSAIVRFTEAYSRDRVLAAFPRGSREFEVEGKTVFQRVGSDHGLSFYFPDDRTIVIGEMPMFGTMLASKGAASPLRALLKSVDVSGHFTAVFSIDAVRPIMKRAIAAAPPVPAPFQGVLRVPDLLSAIVLTVNADESLKGSLKLRAVDDDAAVAIESIINGGLAFGRQMLLAEIAKMPNRGNDPVEEAGAKYLARITNKMFDSIKPVRDGKDVSIKVETAGSPAVIGVLVALLLPAIQAARAAANRNTTLNKLRQIALAMMNFEAVNRRFPAHAIFSKDGKPLLSWRVAILPFLEEKALFDQFHLDEPWDSEHNKPLIAKMPEIYNKPSRPNDGTTVFLVPFGKGLAFEGTEGLKIREFTDGTSKTILAVEVNDDRAVPWTKPNDLEVDLSKPFEGLGEGEEGGISCFAFVDGHTVVISKHSDEATMKALFTRNGGEPIDDSLIR